MSENNLDEREIDLMQMMKYLWRHIIYMCMGAVVGLLVMFILQNIIMENEEVSEGEKTSFEKKMDEYNQDYTQLEMEIENLNKSIEEQIVYNNESILMKINPYNKKSVSGQFYIDSDYQINPELSFQNIDITTSIVRAYQALYTTGELAKYVNEHLETQIKERYLNELISVEYLGDATLEVTVVNTDTEEAKSIYDLVMKCMDEHKAQFEKTIGSYTITKLNESENCFVDLELKAMQVGNLEEINTLKSSLTEKENSLSSLVRPSERSNIVLVGAFLGFVGVFVANIIMFLLDSTIKNDKDVINRLGLSVLGNIPVEKGKEKEYRMGKRNKKKRYIQYGKM